MDDRSPSTRQVWRPSFARKRNRRDSNGSIDDQMSDTSEGGNRTRSPRGRRGGGFNRRGESWRNPDGSGRLGDLRDQLNMSRAASMDYPSHLPPSTKQLIQTLAREELGDWQIKGRRRGGQSIGQGNSNGSNWRGSQGHISSGPSGRMNQDDGSNWRGSQGHISSGPNGHRSQGGVSNWRGSQGHISSDPNGSDQRRNQEHGLPGSSGAPNPQQRLQPYSSQQSNNRRSGQNSNRRWNNRFFNISKLETVHDWTNLSALDNSLRIVTKLQELESSWVKSLHTCAEFEVLDLAFDVFSAIDLKYRYAKLALMKSLFRNEFIERLVRVVEKFKTTWFQAGKDKILSFIGKLRVNLEFVLSNDAAFHENPSSKDAIALLIEGCMGTLEHVNNKLMDLQGSGDQGLEKEILDIQELSEIKFIEMKILDESVYPDDFRERYEVMANIVHGAYQSDDHYIQTHFSLLKEDFQSVLRDGVEQYLIEPKKKNFSIWAYENVVVERFNLSQRFLQERKVDTNRKLFFKITFPECHYFSRIQWKYVKRFMFGSLIVLTSDKFETYHLALIEERFLDNPDAISIVVSFIYSPPDGFEGKKFLLVEPKVFYEPYLNSMKVLKHMAKIGLPMKKYIVNGDTFPKLPAYLNSESVYRIGSHDIKVNSIISWPKAEDLGLNRSQKEAFVNSLTSEMALIQGPPGTGKTFLAFKLIETLLNNCKKSYIDGPIMIVCYKNHSLDQILEGLLKKGKSVIRIGSQSKIKALKWECNVRSLPTPPIISSLLSEKRNLQIKLGSCLADIKKTVSLICLIKSGIGILNSEFLKQFNVIPSDAELPLDVWLLEGFDEASQLTMESIHQQWNEMQKNPDIQSLLDTESLCEVYLSNLISIGGELIEYGVRLSELEKHTEAYEELQDTFWEMNERFSGAYNKYTYLLEGLNYTVDPSDCPDTMAPDFDYFQLNLDQRWALYRKWESCLITQLEAKVVDLQNQVPEIEENLSEYEEMVMSQTLKYESPQVIGITTSGATKHYSALADVGAKIVLVEEAAEVLEAHVIASLSTKCQHLILIGDHQQLKPNTASYEIGTRYRMNVSLFERMIKNDIKLSCLATQHRMRPEIAALICPAIYPNLENHPIVSSYPNVIGTKKNVYFFNHEHLEQVGYDSDSKYNPGEGDMLIAIAYYLTRQGYKPEEITILSTYLEQDRYIKKAIDKYYAGTELKEVFCTVVDNYQGEENIIILLSLVRSNFNGDVGFLSTKNRVCVALSRAKHGLFIFGNMTCLSKKEPTIWSEINEVLIGQEAISNRFPLKCVRHGNITEVASRHDVEALKHAGCLSLCDAPLICGHTCKVMCHGQDQDHSSVFQCREKCMKRCDKGHTCQALCRDRCPPCPFMMPTVLVCGHSRQQECHKANLQAYCTETVELKLESCGHNQFVLCKLTEQSERYRIVCKSVCKQTFKCGHVCKRRCHVTEDPDHKIKFLCEEPCELINKSCPRKHRCKRKCREPCGDCMVKVEKTLQCGHKAEMKCYKDTDKFVCKKNCERKLPCGHGCKNDCCDPCGPCKVEVEKVIDECGHTILFNCCDTATRSHCKQPCQTIRSCGHPCTGMCKEICEKLECSSLVVVALSCGHEALVACGDVTKKSYSFTTNCKAPCKAELPCGHRCKGTCGNCLEGRVHVPCDEPCNKALLCIHKCPNRCSGTLHSCPIPKCFNTCWRNELKRQQHGSKKNKGKRKSNDFNPETRMAFEIRSELRELERQMGKIARSYTGNKVVVQTVRKIQLLVNKSLTMTTNGEELPFLKTCLFKVEFILLVFKIMVRLGMMKLPEATKLEVENLLEKLVVRLANNNLMGFYEMTQLQEQLVWVSMLLDIHNAAAFFGKDNDSSFTEAVFSILDGSKSSFGTDNRAMVWQMIHDYRERMAVKLPLTDIKVEKLFPSAANYCQPICHHRVDLLPEKVIQNGSQCPKAVSYVPKDGKNGGQIDCTTVARSLVSEEYNDDDAVMPKRPKNRTNLVSDDANEKMDVEEVFPAKEAVREISNSDDADTTSGESRKLGMSPQNELTCPGNVNENLLVEMVKDMGAGDAASQRCPTSPYSEASLLLSKVILEGNLPMSQMVSTQDQPQEVFTSHGNLVPSQSDYSNAAGSQPMSSVDQQISASLSGQARSVQAPESTDSTCPKFIISPNVIHQGNPETQARPSPDLGLGGPSSAQALFIQSRSSGQPFDKELNDGQRARQLNVSLNLPQGSHAYHRVQMGAKPILNSHQIHTQADQATHSPNPKLHSLHDQFSQLAVQSGQLNMASQSVRAGHSVTDSTHLSSRLDMITIQAKETASREKKFAMLATAGPSTNRLNATTASPDPSSDELAWNILQPDAEATTGIEGID